MALCIRERTSKVIEPEGCCQLKSNKDLMVHNKADVSTDIIKGRNNAKALDYRNN